MAKKIVNSDIYNLSQLVDDVKSAFIPDETDETLAIGTYGYIGALESHRLQTQVQMTGELCNEVFPSRARLDRNVITHAIMTNIENINAIPAKMIAFLALKADDLIFDDKTNAFIVDRECPIYLGDFEFHLEYDVKLKRILINKKNSYSYTAQYIIPPDRDVPTSTIDSTTQYLSPPAVVMIDGDAYIYLTVVLSQVEHTVESKKLVTSNIIDNKTMNFNFDNQLAYFEVHVKESDQDYFLTPVFEGSAVPESNAKFYCWYQYIDTDLIRVRFDRRSYMPGLNATVECLIKTCQGASGNFTYGENEFIDLESKKYGYKGITCLLTPISSSEGGKDKKSKKELQALIPKEALSRGSLTTITDLNNYFSMLDSEYGRIFIQKKTDNQIERVYYAYFVAKDQNLDVIPTNTVDIKIGLDDMIKSTISETDSPKYLVPSGSCFKLGEDNVAYINKDPIIDKGYIFTPKPTKRGNIVTVEFTVQETDEIINVDDASCSIDIGGNCNTFTNVFPSEDKYRYDNKNTGIIVEDYMQMGPGRIYNYLCEYVTQEDNCIITANDLGLDCFDFIEGSYTVNGYTRPFNKLPIVAYDLPANTKITFSIKRRLNNKASNIISFSHGYKQYKLNHKRQIKLSTVLNNLNAKGNVTNAAVDSEYVILTEDGNIHDPKMVDIKTLKNNDESFENPFVKKVLNEGDLPTVSDRRENEWYWAITQKGIISDKSNLPASFTMINGESDEPFTLYVLEENDLPSPENRKPNEWYYVITNRDGEDTVNAIVPFAAKSNNHKVHIINNNEELPPVGERGTKDDWYIIVTDRSVISDDGENIPTELTGKEYNITINGNSDEPVILHVTLDEKIYDIIVINNCFDIENGIIVNEAGNVTHKNIYHTYIPVLEQNRWPGELNPGEQITYTLKYKSSNDSYSPKIMIKLSKGLEYVLFSNTVTYKGKTPISYEPVETILDTEKGFFYTNPYAVNINAYRLYSAFYMMSMDENPYLQFSYINDKSNVQFISTNIHWNRPLYSDDNNKYKLSITLTQSVQDNIGLISDDKNTELTPLVKAVAVFYRDGKPYRYRSLNLVSFDPINYSFDFAKEFNSSDIFDNNNNIKITGTQVIGQAEYKIILSYKGEKYYMTNGGVADLNTIMKQLKIDPAKISQVISSNRYAIEAYPIKDDAENIINYQIRSFTDLKENGTLSIYYATGGDPIVIDVESTTINPETEYGYFNPITDIKIYTLCGLPDTEGVYSRYDFDAVCPGLKKWTLTNVFDVVRGVTMYHNYSEIMGSRVTPYGKKYIDSNNNIVTKLEGFKVNSVPMIGFDYCQDENLAQNAINALNYRKAYIDNAMTVLENSFGIDFKLFNTYGPSNTFYIIKDSNSNGLLDEEIEFIDRVNLTLNFRVKLISANDSYTKDNIINEIKSYIEDLDDISQLHIPNLIAQITMNYKEQISYFEYLGFNNYGPDVQHIYKVADNELPIHTAPEFLCINNVVGIDKTTHPDINIFVSEI